MNFELSNKVTELLKANKIEDAITLLENQLKSLEKTDFHEIIGIDLTPLKEFLCEQINSFYKASKKKIKDVQAIYCEMNGFTVNYDIWYVELFSYTQFKGLNDLDWLSEFDCCSNQEELISFGGLEELQAIFKDYIEKERWRDSNYENSFELGEILIILRFQQAFHEAILIAKNKGFTWTKIPFLMTAHDYNLIYNSIGTEE